MEKRIKFEHGDIVRFGTGNIKFHDLSPRKIPLVYNPHPLHIVTMIFLDSPAAVLRENQFEFVQSYTFNHPSRSFLKNFPSDPLNLLRT